MSATEHDPIDAPELEAPDLVDSEGIQTEHIAGLLFGAVLLLAGGIAIFSLSTGTEGRFTGGALAMMGLAIVFAAIWVRGGRS